MIDMSVWTGFRCRSYSGWRLKLSALTPRTPMGLRQRTLKHWLRLLLQA